MQSVTQMQLAGLSEDKAVANFDRGVAEIRLMESIFDKTKTAIRSWGKYVPWPVVQILLAAGIDSSLKMGTTEVTMFFSDIASFTTIVEKLPPERSLVLLSRYFNDMSQVIDTHGGIVI
ncbi:cya1, partial [Symbiodinium pilosum]